MVKMVRESGCGLKSVCILLWVFIRAPEAVVHSGFIDVSVLLVKWRGDIWH